MPPKDKEKATKSTNAEEGDSSVQKKKATAVAVGVGGAAEKVLVSERICRGMCRFCDQAVYSDQARRNCVKGYFHTGCHKELGKCYICNTEVMNSDLYAFNKRGHYHVVCIGTFMGNCRFCHENVYTSTRKRGNDGNGYFHDECKKGMVPVSVAGGGNADAGGSMPPPPPRTTARPVEAGASAVGVVGKSSASGASSSAGGSMPPPPPRTTARAVEAGGKSSASGASSSAGGNNGGGSGMPPQAKKTPAPAVKTGRTFQMSSTFFAHVHNANEDESAGMDPPPDV